MSLDAEAPPHAEASEQHIRHPRDVWGSTITVVIAAVALQRSISYGIEGRTQVVGPGMFPAIVSAALVLLGLMWALQTWRKSIPQPEEPIELPDRGGITRIAITVAAMLVPALVFNLVDFRLTVFAMSFSIMRFVFGSPLILAATVSAGLSAICYFGLALGLGMVLPLSF